MSAKIRRIKKAEITRVALVPRGANRLPALYKSDGSLELAPLSKFDGERGEMLTLVYVPDKIDSQGHFASLDVVQEMAHSHMRNSGELDLRHDEKPLTKEQAYLAESFIVQAGDPRYQGWKDLDGNPVDATGGWGQVIKIDDLALRKQCQDEGWGVSLYSPSGKAVLEEVSDEIVARFRKSKEDEMNTEEVKAQFGALMKEQIPAIVSAVAEALKPKPEIKKEEPKDEAPVLALEDRTNPEKVREYQKALKLHELQKATVWTDQKSIDTYLEKVAALETKPKEETDEVKSLRKQLEKALGASSAPDSKENEPDAPLPSGLTKEQFDGMRAGAKAAEALNKTRGFAAN